MDILENLSYLPEHLIEEILQEAFTEKNELIRILEAFPEKPWNWEKLSRNPNITMEFVSHHLDKPWIWKYLSSNPGIKMEDISQHMDKPWNWLYLSINPNITMEDVLNHPEIRWNWILLSRNPNITMEFISQHLNPSLSDDEIDSSEAWNWGQFGLSSNKFTKDPHLIKKRQKERQKERQKLMSLIIEQY